MIGDFLKDYINRAKFPFINIEYFPTLPSTNAYLKLRADSSDEGLIIIAENQTAGRGRFDRKFYSPKNSGIYMSILLKPKFTGFNTTLITTAAAVAVAKACEELSGKETKIKWVNDVLINGKKVCGILTEGSINPENRSVNYVVLGIGINVFTPENGFDDEIKDIAAGVFDEYRPELKKQLTARVINLFFEYYSNLTDKQFLKDYREKSAVIGKEITVIKGEQNSKAIALMIDDDCRLKIEYEDKTTELLSSGEISIKI